MDSIFGIGLPELIVILLLAGIVMGPQRIRQVALWLGRMTAQLQAISRSFTRQLNAELDAMDGGDELKGTMQDIQELRQQLQELRREVVSMGQEPVTAAPQSRQETQARFPDLPNRIQPPPETDAATPSGNGHTVIPQPISVPDDPDA